MCTLPRNYTRFLLSITRNLVHLCTFSWLRRNVPAHMSSPITIPRQRLSSAMESFLADANTLLPSLSEASNVVLSMSRDTLRMTHQSLPVSVLHDLQCLESTLKSVEARTRRLASIVRNLRHASMDRSLTNGEFLLPSLPESEQIWTQWQSLSEQDILPLPLRDFIPPSSSSIGAELSEPTPSSTPPEGVSPPDVLTFGGQRARVRAPMPLIRQDRPSASTLSQWIEQERFGSMGTMPTSTPR